VQTVNYEAALTLALHIEIVSDSFVVTGFDSEGPDAYSVRYLDVEREREHVAESQEDFDRQSEERKAEEDKQMSRRVIWSEFRKRRGQPPPPKPHD